jgi:hypothetical protein
LTAKFKLGHYPNFGSFDISARIIAPSLHAHAVGAHVAEGHGGGLIRHTYFRLCELLHTKSGDLRAHHKIQMSNLGRNLLIAIVTAVICEILLYAAIRI